MSRAADFDHIHELFAVFGSVAVRRMFGGAGVFSDGLMFALIADGVVYLKADDLTSPAFVREDLKPFSYATKDGSRTITSYWRMPDRLYDDAEELARWAGEAFAVARRKSKKSTDTKQRPRGLRRKRASSVTRP